MGPRWPRLALRSLVRGGPAWPCFDCGGLITSGQERQTLNSVAFGCISLHFLSSTRGRGHPHPSLLPSKEKGPDRLRGNDECSARE